MNRMTLPIFLELVEIKTKLASFFPFLIGLLFTYSYFHSIDWVNTGVFFIGMLAFDMTTTAINNYMDYKKAKSEVYKYQENIIGRAHLPEKKVIHLIIAMLLLAAIVGIFLSIRTGWLFLFMGLVCCFIGVFYTFGPVPLSRMPIGEVFSGVTMGFGIFLMVVYINSYSFDYFTLQFSQNQFLLQGNIQVIWMLFFVSLPLVFTIANIMLANNLCDLETDIENHRYTLPYYIGKTAGIRLFTILMYSCYAVVLFSVFFGYYTWTMLIVFLTFPKIRQNLHTFTQKQIKSETFVLSIQNLVLFNGSQVVGLFFSILLSVWVG